MHSSISRADAALRATIQKTLDHSWQLYILGALLCGQKSRDLYYLMSSTKSATGHLLGAAGSVEAIFSILALRDGIIPPTLNLNNPDDACDLNFVPNVAQEHTVKYVMSNSFGFGGTNASLIFGSL